jgi:hypothetical protein
MQSIESELADARNDRPDMGVDVGREIHDRGETGSLVEPVAVHKMLLSLAVPCW